LGQTDEIKLNVLLELIGNKNEKSWERLNATRTLEELGYIDIAKQSLRELMTDKKTESWVRGNAAIRLGKFGQADQVTLKEILTLAKNELVEGDTRGDAANALGQLGYANEEILKTLLELVNNEKEVADARVDAAMALGKLGKADEAKEVLWKLARDEDLDIWIREKAVRTLGELGQVNETILKSLLETVNDEKVDAEIRSDIYSLLKSLLSDNQEIIRL